MRFLLILPALLLYVPPAAAQAPALGIDAGTGVERLDVIRSRGDALFALAALAPLGARLETDERGGRLTWFGETLRFDVGSPFFRAGRKVFQLVAPVRRDGARIFVATQFMTEWAPAHFRDRLVLRDGVLRTSQPVARASRPREPARSGAQARVVIIDAGHGGRDAGKIGPNGLAEKDVTLSVAAKLAALLQSNGYEVHLTRTTDTLIALADRPRLANQWKNGRPAALFVSVHANAGVSSAAGYETFFLSEARTEDERRVAEMENAAVAFEEEAPRGPAIEQLLSGLRNDYYQRASNDLAEVIQRELAAFHPGRSRGVKQAGFRVLVGALMPAVLAEIAFISNPEEARLLGTAAFQDKIAYGLARSIATFFDEHEHLWQARAGEP